VGIPYENVGLLNAAGAVQILYGSTAGLAAIGSQWLNQATAGAEDGAEAHDRFGWSLAAGDFNRDGRHDLAVGVPDEAIGSPAIQSAGVVQVFYGSAGGLTLTGDQFWHQDVADVEGGAEPADQFGSALATGDFNCDGYPDLAIGVPGEDVSGVLDAGAVNILYGSAAGLTAAGDQVWHQDSAGVQDAAEEGDAFGTALAAGDHGGDGCADLAVGVPYEDLGSTQVTVDAGMVQVIYGTAGGLAIGNNQFWHQGVANVEGDIAAFDKFGYSLAAGDYNGDGSADLAVGVFGEAVGGNARAGA
jgi:hypothetical protein